MQRVASVRSKREQSEVRVASGRNFMLRPIGVKVIFQSVNFRKPRKSFPSSSVAVEKRVTGPPPHDVERRDAYIPEADGLNRQ